MFIIYKDKEQEARINSLLEGKQVRQKLTKVDIKVPVEELPGEDILDVYGAYNGHADDMLKVLADIENQVNKDVAEGEKRTTFKTSMKEFLDEMKDQKAFVFAYRNKEGLNASLYTSQVEFNNACRAKKRSIKAMGEFSDAFEKQVCQCNSMLTNFGELDDRKIGILNQVMDKVLGDKEKGLNKKELGKLFDAMATRCLGRIPHEDEQVELPEDNTTLVAEPSLTPTTDTTENPNGGNVVNTTTQAETAVAQETNIEYQPSQKVEAAQRSALEFYKRMKKFYE